MIEHGAGRETLCAAFTVPGVPLGWDVFSKNAPTKLHPRLSTAIASRFFCNERCGSGMIELGAGRESLSAAFTVPANSLYPCFGIASRAEKHNPRNVDVGCTNPSSHHPVA